MNKETLTLLNDTMLQFYGAEDLNFSYIRGLLLPFLQDLIDMYENDFLILEGDCRSGEEVYGYESEESIIGNIDYISDRWKCAMRIRWMIDLIDPDYYPYRGDISDDYIPREREF